MKSRNLFGMVALAAATVAFAAAGQGLKWNATTTYYDGSPLTVGQKVAYLVYDSANGKQVYSTPTLSAAKDKLPADGCYYLMAALMNDAGTGIVEGSQSAPTEPKCTKTTVPTPVQKRLSTPTGFDFLP